MTDNFLFNWLASLTAVLSSMLIVWIYFYIMENAYPFNPNSNKRMFIADHIWILEIIALILIVVTVYFAFPLISVGGGK